MKIIADENIPFVKQACETVGDVVLVSGRAFTPELVKDADALLVRSITKVNKELLDGSSVKFVGTATIGFEHIDREYLAEKAIGFSSAPGSNANSVAEYIIAALLNLAEKYKFDLSEKSIGIIGVGNVGSRVEKKAEALGMKVVCNDPPLSRETDDEKYRPIDEIYSCDIITVHTPLTKEGIDKTCHLCDEAFFDKLKDSAVFINSSRGGVVKTKAIKNVIKNEKLLVTVLDVWENEPNIDNQLLSMVDIGTPHIAGYSYDGKIVGMIMVYEAMCRHFGLEIKASVEDFLPEPIVPTIEITSDKSEQRLLLDTVSKIYDIMADDGRCRGILEAKDNEKGQFFDTLRKKYPIRREFQNTVISCNDNDLKQKLSGLGFKI